MIGKAKFNFLGKKFKYKFVRGSIKFSELLKRSLASKPHMLLKDDYLLKPERFHISDLSTPVYLQADGKRFLQFSYNPGSCIVHVRSGKLSHQQEIPITIKQAANYFHSKEAAREFIHRETWRYCTEEGFKPAEWIPQELNNYLQNPHSFQPLCQGASYTELHGTQQRNKSSYQLNQIAKEMATKKLSTELNEGYFIYSYVEQLRIKGLEGAYLVKIYERFVEILKIQWKGNVLKIESENGKDYHKEFWQFTSEKKVLKDAEEKIRKLVEQGFKFKLEKFIYDFYEDESEITRTGKNFNTIRDPVVNAIKAPCSRSQLSPRGSLPSQSRMKAQPERRCVIFPKPEDPKKSIFDAQLVADKIIERIDQRRKRSDSIEIGVGTDNQEDSQNFDFQLPLPPYHGQAYNLKPENLRERSPKQIFQRRQMYSPQNDEKDYRYVKNLRGISPKEDGLCVICMDKERSMAFIPCGHKKTCESCCALIMRKDANCPVCRMGINSTLRIYE